MPVFAGLAPAAMAAGPATLTGSLTDGATYLIQVPDAWNGTLVLYSHGIVIPGSPNPARGAGDPLTGQYLLDHGYALAGSSYATTGWAVQDGLADQIATLDAFGRLVRHPARTIAWGHSLGGLITAGLIQRNPDRFAGALPMCGPVSAVPSGFDVVAPGLGQPFTLDVFPPPEHLGAAVAGRIAATRATSGPSRGGGYDR